MPFRTAYQNKIPRLYHWQRFDADRFAQQLRNCTVYCSSPRDFNDPWDCRPFFNTDLLADPAERQKHIDWAVEICKRHAPMSDNDMDRMKRELQDPIALERYVRQSIVEVQKAVLERYRVYCLCPDVNNVLMWAHYGASHTGICLEFNVANETICSAQEVKYFKQFPMTPQYSKDEDENSLPLLSKGDVWQYEHEYRLIAQDADNRTPHDTLLTHDGHLKLAGGALLSVIVGHLGPYEQVQDLVVRHAPSVKVLRAHLVPNKYELIVGP